SRLDVAQTTLSDTTAATQRARVLYQAGILSTTDLLANEQRLREAQLGLVDAQVAELRASGLGPSQTAEFAAQAATLRTQVAASAEAAAKREQDIQAEEAAAGLAGAAPRSAPVN
ncbi:MAG: hypothetical protein JWM33_141, partial [Caulobacteraceae bacterium]|nr:hypothetical protein [Caulobacteraceae bacterium]